MSLANNVEFLRHLPGLTGFGGLGDYTRSRVPDYDGPLHEVTGFGSNPGALKMFSYVPENLPRGAALVVALHGCGQTAAGYDVGTGWSALATRYGFALLMPEQKPSNNCNTCFNWFKPEDAARGRGEACSIRQMIARLVADHKLDPRRIYITGLSAGGAMSSVMLAAYPDVFAAGAIIAGLPFGVADNLRHALTAMMQAPRRKAHQLGDFVRKASKYKGPWPKVSVWHGSADRTVNPGNADEIVKQWLDVHDLPQAPMAVTDVDGFPRQVWWNDDGETVVESYTITDMAHGAPLGAADNDERYGEAGAFLIEAGITSSYHIANFFGLTGRVRASSEIAVPERPAKPAQVATSSRRTAQLRKLRSRRRWRRQAIQFGSAITRALTAAGLMKSRGRSGC